MNNKNYNLLSIFSAALTVVAHIAIGVIVFQTYRYYELSMGTFLSTIGAVVCLLIITDIVLFVGINYKEKALSIVSCAMATAIVIAGIVGISLMHRVNSVVDKVLENSNTVEQYEMVDVTFISYGKEYKDLKDIDGKIVGVIKESTEAGSTSLAKDKIDEVKVDVAISEYDMMDDVFFALVRGDVDVAALPSSYHSRYTNTSEEDTTDYSEYLDKVKEICSFERKVQTGENAGAKRDLTAEPFNILLIGFAPETKDMKHGLSDAIIVATVNPQTMQVLMTSIARDSFVPISCYGGRSDKINAARSSSRNCLMQTVGNLLDMQIDYYMEVNFKAIVDIVDAIGGIEINSPVEFVGQNSSVTRGEMTVWIPKGFYHADGEAALAFARERHAMPNGDFDRQKHQQEVIKAIAEKLVNLDSASAALKILDSAGENVSTNLSLSQLTNVYNLIANMKNSTGFLNNFDCIDIMNSRVTGYSSWTYNYGMHLPLWIYKLYNGSINETKTNIVNVMGDYKNIKQSGGTTYWYWSQYYKDAEALYHDSYNEKQEHEVMPSFYPYLTRYTYDEALKWAANNGVKMGVHFIVDGDAGYVDSQFGKIVDQSVKHGALVSENPSCTITVMGDLANSVALVQNFVEKDYALAIKWAKEVELPYKVKWAVNTDPSLAGVVISQTPTAGKRLASFTEIEFEVNEFPNLTEKLTSLVVGASTIDDAKAWAKKNLTEGYGTAVYKTVVTTDPALDGKLQSVKYDDTTPKSNSEFTFVFYALGETYTVKFVDENDVQIGETQTVNKGEDAVAPALPAKDGFTASWDKSYKNVQGDLVVKVKYTAISTGGGTSGGESGGTSGGESGGTSGGESGGTSGGESGGTSGGESGGASGGESGGTSGGESGGESGGTSGGESGGTSGGESGGE